jgi:arabinogalactan endo-1,4-beta-galactosidase
MKGSLLIGIISFITGTFFTVQVKAVLGADLSWVTQMEASGYTWKNASGTTQDIFTICKGLGFSSVRLRVFVNPSNGYCGQADVVAKAKRAAAQGMSVYLTFHLSDTWADPGHQTPPAAWASHNISQLYTDVYNHVKTVVTAVRAVSNVGWVSIGNETNNGLLWPLGQASTNPANYAGLIRSGYNGAKAAGAPYVGVHVSNMADYAVYTWNFGILYSNGVSWDFCAASLYPTTSNYATLISQAKTTAAAMSSKYGKSCVIAEFGIAYNSGSTGAAALKSARTICNDLFYWEPECYNWQGYSMGAWDPSTKMPTVILTSGLKSAVANSIEETPQTEKIVVYPNPCNGDVLNLNLNGLTGTTNVRILNVNGSILVEKVVYDQQIITLNNLNLSAGAYFLQISNSQKKEIRTIVVR